MTLLMHRSQDAATLDDICSIPLPKATRTYQPVSHGHLSSMLIEMAENLLPNFSHT